MRKWLNELIKQILFVALMIWTLWIGFCFEVVIVDDALSTSSMTAPANIGDFIVMVVVYVSMVGVLIFCGIWGKSILSNLIAGAYGLLEIYIFWWSQGLTYRPLFASWESRVEILFNAAHIIIFVTALVGLVRSGRALYLKIKQTCLKHREYS